MDDRETELLSRHIDGELSPAEQIEVRELLTASAPARAFLQRMQRSDDTLRGAFAGTLDEAIPAHLMHALEGGNVTPIPSDRPATPRRAVNQAYFALAASLVLAVGASLTQLFPDPDTAGLAPMDHRLLQTVLTQAASHERTPSPDGSRFALPTATYLTDGGQTCREFELQGPDRVVTGLACLQPDAVWELESVLVSTRQQTGSSEYQPANGERDPVSEALDRLNASAPLDRETEASLRLRGWRNSH